MPSAPPANESTSSVPLPSASHRGSVSGVPRPKVYKSPEPILRPLSPPCCLIGINNNDHRWTSTWKRGVESEYWLDELKNRSYTISFTTENWVAKLRQIHRYVWEKWEIAAPHDSKLQLPIGQHPQAPGLIPDDAVEKLREVIAGLPPKKIYSRR